jgi:pimeloyl-ACP methyl ester carboxylesterase
MNKMVNTSLQLIASLMAIASLSAVSAQGMPVMSEHYVANVSLAPSMEGQVAQIYVREYSAADGEVGEGDVVLFVHGAGTPAEVAFDAPHSTYSWMRHLANAGFNTFAMDTTGYGRSTRPYPMNDPCNLPENQREEFVPQLIAQDCEPSYGYAATTIASDWDDIDAVVDYLRGLRGVERVHLVAWSLGGPRAGGYAARHPEKVGRLVLLAPAYSRNRSEEAPELPVAGSVFSKQSHADFIANWDRQSVCANQYEPAAAAAIWQAMLESDPVGASWGTGVRRAPRTITWGWGPSTVGDTEAPMLLIAPIHDAQVPVARVQELYEDLGSSSKVLLDLGCSSHNAMWEMNHLLMFEDSVEWLRSGTVNGMTNGSIRRGY